jgi:cytochrome c oxidase subunit 2
MIMFFWGTKLFIEIQRVPPEGDVIYVVGKRWMWKLQHANGRGEINSLHIPRGRTVKLRMISEDVIHSFFVPNFRIKQDVLPGRYTTLWVTPTRVGEYHLFCAEYCGTSHSQMIGKVVVLEPADYARWLSGRPTGATADISGGQLFQQLRCNTCHHAGEGARCPPLNGLFGSQVRLNDGRVVVVDEDYIRESILDPNAKIVEGYLPLMPTYSGQVGEEAILEIVAYIKSLPPLERPPDAAEPSNDDQSEPTD